MSSIFPETVLQAIREEFHQFCVLCQRETTDSGGHVAHFLDDEQQVNTSITLGLIPKHFTRSGVVNGMWLCPYCHLNLFTLSKIVPACFFPSEPVLDYLLRFYHTHPESNLGVDQILDGLYKNPSKSPKAAAFLGLFRLCPTGPPRTSDRDFGRLRYHFTMSTDHFPPLQILNDNYQFVDAEPFVSNDTPSYRIYDAASLVPEDPSFSLGVIPLFRDDIPEYKQQYWRLNRPLGLVLGFIHTHLIQQQYSLPTGSYQLPIECVKTRMVIRMIEDRVFNAQTLVDISLVDVPHVTGSAESDECSQHGKQDVGDSNLGTKEDGDMEIDCTEVSGSDDMQIPTRVNCVESFLSSLKDLDLDEPIDISKDNQSEEVDDDLYDPKTLAPRPVRTPCATDTDTEGWEYGPRSSATSIIHHYTGRHEKVPWMMQKRYYPSLDGKMYLSSTF